MSVSNIDATAVRVSWTRLNSDDVAHYRVYYSPASSERERQTERSQLFPGEASSGVVGGLEEGVEFRFEVAAVVMVGDELTDGQRSEESVVTVGETGNALSITPGSGNSFLCPCISRCHSFLCSTFLLT